MTLGSGAGYGFDNSSQTITIADNPHVLQLKAGQNPTEGGSNEIDLGWFTISSNKPAPNGGLRVRYQIAGGTATRGSDYYAPQATLSTSSFLAEDIVVLPTNSSEARIYISVIADAIREGNETISLQLIPNIETDDQGFSYQRYNVDNNFGKATLTINDSDGFGVNANAATTSRDSGTTLSPVGGVPLRMNVTSNDPYLTTYNTSQWNIAEAKPGETWTLSVYAKADRATSGQLFIFE
ncbi:MAG: hypothetical protein EBU88_20010, partial [Acidobacteria bacterium]|nr:hypothetical protein [Acidobacteriota bacterium]